MVRLNLRKCFSRRNAALIVVLLICSVAFAVERFQSVEISSYILSPVFKSSSSNPASAGIVRLSNTDFLKWRNAGNSADLGLQLDASNIFQLGSALTVSGNILGSNLSGTNSGDVTIGTFGSAPDAKGLTISSQVVTLQPADATHPGALTTGAQTIAGAKTFSSTIVGDISGNAATVTTNANLTGDVTSSGNATTLATVNSNVGSFGTASNVGTVAVNAKGLVTAASNTAIAIAESQVTSLVSDLAGKQASGNYLTALTGDATASGPGSAAITLATVNSNVGSFGSSTSIPSLTVNAKGLVTAASGNVVIAPAGTLTGTTLASNVVSSSLTSVGTITSGTWTGTTLAIANGGTGQTTAANAINALVPSQTSNSGKFLTTDGSVVSWGTVSGTGDVSSNTSSSVVNEIALFSDTGGKTIKRATGTGVAHVTSGVLSASTVVVLEGGTGITSGTSGGIPYFSSTSTIASSGALLQNQLAIGGGAGAAPSTLGSLGTTTTLLHGNAAGAPTFGAVSLTADVSGTLPVANGGTGQTSYTDGQLLIGNTSGNTLTKATLTAGSGVTVTNGNGSITVATTGLLARTSKTANYTITSTDSVIECDTTGGAFNLTLPDPTTVAGKMYRIVDVANAGSFQTNNLTLVRNGSERIAGVAASLILSAAGGQYSIYSDGTNWWKLGTNSNRAFKTFTGSGTFTPPGGVTNLFAWGRPGAGGGSGGSGGGGGFGGATGGGGGGGKGGPGGGGAQLIGPLPLSVTAGSGITVTIGAGGTAGSAGTGGTPNNAATGGSAGGTGSQTSIGSIIFGRTATTGATGGAFATTQGAAGTVGAGGAGAATGAQGTAYGMFTLAAVGTSAGGAGATTGTGTSSSSLGGQGNSIFGINTATSAGSIGAAATGTASHGGGGGSSGGGPGGEVVDDYTIFNLAVPSGGTGGNGGAAGNGTDAATGATGSNGSAGSAGVSGRGGGGGGAGGGGGGGATTGGSGGNGGAGAAGSDGVAIFMWNE